ncbi:HAD family hydrolase [Hymenobacter lapidiphilus]|uniref:HAD family hydrolase n=1 Tax=Hymenobacter lapidiphilus TaxID=2608003 RepID=A0A7Y7U3S2_9BACT|nr:HAD family hydrolase [Hymenobacter lapidiphilus]NVO29653.1 HAD family hydrolase [Hymenobacter lapidiphilus]
MTVLFDLDDTLYDHTATARTALAATAAGWASLRGVPADVLYQRYSDLLEEMHPRVMRGELDYLTARELRFRQLLAPYESAPTAGSLAQLAEEHYGHYRQFRQPVAGALALLQRLKPDFRIGVVTNNRTSEQEEKLDFLGMSGLVDALITSEAVGVLKPDPAIYHVALQRLRARPAETVMVGDNWIADVVGAQAVGIRPVWLNRGGSVAPTPAVAELSSLEPLELVYALLTTAAPC